MCGNGKIDGEEECDPKDETQENWWTKWCSNSCQKVDKDAWECNPEYDGQSLKLLLNSDVLCLRWKYNNFWLNLWKWSWVCVNETTGLSTRCFAKKVDCGDWVIWKDEKCYNCPLDLKDICVTDGNEKCKCDECPEKLKDICVTDGNEKCKCDECPEKLKDICVTDWKEKERCNCLVCPEKLKDICVKDAEASEPVIDNPENPNKPDKWNIKNDNCSTCPCEYADFSADLSKWDTIRAKLWDKSLSAFYRYSNVVAVESFLGDY